MNEAELLKSIQKLDEDIGSLSNDFALMLSQLRESFHELERLSLEFAEEIQRTGKTLTEKEKEELKQELSKHINHYKKEYKKIEESIIVLEPLMQITSKDTLSNLTKTIKRIGLEIDAAEFKIKKIITPISKKQSGNSFKPEKAITRLSIYISLMTEFRLRRESVKGEGIKKALIDEVYRVNGDTLSDSAASNNVIKVFNKFKNKYWPEIRTKLHKAGAIGENIIRFDDMMVDFALKLHNHDILGDDNLSENKISSIISMNDRYWASIIYWIDEQYKQPKGCNTAKFKSAKENSPDISRMRHWKELRQQGKEEDYYESVERYLFACTNIKNQ